MRIEFVVCFLLLMNSIKKAMKEKHNCNLPVPPFKVFDLLYFSGKRKAPKFLLPARLEFWHSTQTIDPTSMSEILLSVGASFCSATFTS